MHFYSIFSCISILNSNKPKLFCSLDDKVDFYTVCHVLDLILMDVITCRLKYFVNNVCRSVRLINYMQFCELHFSLYNFLGYCSWLLYQVGQV